MHIHLPKPLHGWRALVGEIGIIVVGVLIALSAEQFAEFMHNRGQVRQGEEALKDNFRSSCLHRGDRRLRALHHWQIGAALPTKRSLVRQPPVAGGRPYSPGRSSSLAA